MNNPFDELFLNDGDFAEYESSFNKLSPTPPVKNPQGYTARPKAITAYIVTATAKAFCLSDRPMSQRKKRNGIWVPRSQLTNVTFGSQDVNEWQIVKFEMPEWMAESMYVKFRMLE